MHIVYLILIILVISFLITRNKRKDTMNNGKIMENTEEKAELGISIVKIGVNKFSESFHDIFLLKLQEINNLKIYTNSEKVTTKLVKKYYLNNVNLNRDILDSYKLNVNNFLSNHDKNYLVNKDLLKITFYEYLLDLKLIIFKINQSDEAISIRSKKYQDEINELLENNRLKSLKMKNSNKIIQKKLSDLEDKIHEDFEIKSIDSEKISKLINNEVLSFEKENQKNFKKIISNFDTIFENQLKVILERIESKKIKLTNIIIQSKYGNVFDFSKDFEEEIEEFKNTFNMFIEKHY